jgi:glycosyltransferase involved in cell wall biosynthesis
MNISVLLIACNEEKNIARCLAALHWCDDVLLIDSGSTDNTVAIALQHGARVLSRPFDNFAGQRNYGLEFGEFKHEWVLHLDADEVMTPELRQEIACLPGSDTCDGFWIPSKTIFNGRWLRHAGMYPSYQVRLGHRDRLRFQQVGHGQREICDPSRLGTFNEAYLHYSFSHGLRAWLSKHMAYAADEAQVLAEQRRTRLNVTAFFKERVSRRRVIKAATCYLPLTLRPALRFIYVYVFKLGFRDGYNGFFYAFMLATYEAMIAILAAEVMGKTQMVGEHEP